MVSDQSNVESIVAMELYIYANGMSTRSRRRRDSHPLREGGRDMVDAIGLLSNSAYSSRLRRFTLGDSKEQSVGEVSYKIHCQNTLAGFCRLGPDSTFRKFRWPKTELPRK